MPMKCHGCETEIRPEHPFFGNPERSDPASYQGDAALHLRVTGGHGEFFDTIDGPIDLIFCHVCGHIIFRQFPHLVERFRGSHSLRVDVAPLDAMCWGLDGEDVTFGDGLREPQVRGGLLQPWTGTPDSEQGRVS